MTLNTLVRPGLDQSSLRQLVHGIAGSHDLWRPLVRFGNRQRWWTRLYGDSSVDVWLLTWLTDTSTDLHDHGGSAAAFTVVEGVLDELRVVDHTGTPQISRLRPGTDRHVAPGVIHDVRSPGPDPAISIHAYSPPLTTMTFYEQHGQQLVPIQSVPTDQPEPVSR